MNDLVVLAVAAVAVAPLALFLALALGRGSRRRRAARAGWRAVVGTVVAHRMEEGEHGDARLAVVRYEAGGQTHEVARHEGHLPLGARVDLLHDPADPADVMTGADARTPLWPAALVVLAATLGAGALIFFFVRAALPR